MILRKTKNVTFKMDCGNRYEKKFCNGNCYICKHSIASMTIPEAMNLVRLAEKSEIEKIELNHFTENLIEIVWATDYLRLENPEKYDYKYLDNFDSMELKYKFIDWANEFEQIHKGKDWNEEDYFETIENFTAEKLEEFVKEKRLYAV